MVLYFAKRRGGLTLFPRPWFFLITIIILVISLSLIDLYGQNIPFSSAYNAGLLSSDRFDRQYDAPLLQPSILPDVEQPRISANARSHFTGFGIFDLGLHYITSVAGHFGVGMSVQSIGSSNYKVSEAVLSMGRKLSSRIGIGISQKLTRSRIGGEGRPVRGSSSVSMSFDSGTWGFGFHLGGLMAWNMLENFNPFSVHVASYFSWESMTRLYLMLSYEDSRWTPIVGLRQIIHRNIAVYGAFRIYPARYSAGFSLPLTSRLLSHLSVQHHPVLGWSPSIGLNWRLSDSRQDSIPLNKVSIDRRTG